LERNRVVNLTAVRDPAEAWEKLVLGSMLVLDAHDWSGGERVADVGSGGGLPGIPLKIALPGLRMTLVESDQKKAEFLRYAVDTLKLDNVTVEARRAEELGREPEHRAGYDVVVTRDWREAGRALGQLGGRMRKVVGGVVVVGKGRPTPDSFPRRVGVPAKKPL